MSVRRILAILALCLLATPTWAQMQPNGIANYPPEVQLSARAAGQQFVIGSSMTMQATAFDVDDGIKNVDFLVDGASVATDFTDGYSGAWTVTAGSHTVAARATDNRDSSTTTTAITITTAANTPPSVALTAPTAGSSWTVGTALPMTATASDSDGTINRVEFWVDNVKKGEDTSSPYAYSGWTVTAGDHAIKVKAVDNLGAVTSTSAINIHGNYLPTVNLTGPAAGATYTVGTAVPMSATASDSDGTINRVEFWVDGAKVGQDASSPYTYNSWIATAGDHAVQAKAFDNRGGMTSTSAINIHGNFLPTVSLTGPVGGASYSPGATVVMSATASDSDGTINRVEFWVDGAKVDQDASSPYSRNWIATTVGDHTVEAKAFDNRSGMTGSGPVTIHVVNAPPTVSLTTPANGASYTTGATVAMTATASDSDGSIDRVEFLVDGGEVGQDTSSPYTYSWTSTTGTHTVQARAVDDDNGTKTTTSISITVTPTNTLPTVSLTAPANGASYTTGATVAMTATASDSDGSIDRVEFLVDGGEVGQDTSSPYTYSWTSTTGTHTVQARAVDDDNGTKTTTSISITVTPTNTPPTVSLTKPTNGQTFPVGNVTFTATAGDSDGTVDHVEFWVGVNKINQDTASPYTYDWPATAGDYDVLAKSVDNLGATTSTSAITIHVVANTPPTVSLTAPANGASYDSGDIVTLSATASDSDGTIGHVQFLVDGNEIVQDGSSPYGTTWSATTGPHTITAVAVDDSGDSSTPGNVSITVTAPPPPPQARLYTYNSYHELCSVEEPETGVTLMGYDGAGNLKWSASGLADGAACSSTGNTTAILARKAVRTYDARNRISTLTFPDYNGNQEWHYTPDGLPASVTTTNDAGASSVVNTYSYNQRRLLVQEQQQADTNTWTVGYGYDANAHLSTLTYPDSLSVAYAPNALGQPTQAGTYATNVTYYPNGAIAGFTYGNGIVHSLTQNTRGLPDRSQDLNGSTSIHDDGYDYDEVGNVAGISDAVTGNRGDRTMTYDDLNRLTQVTGNNGPSLMFGTASYTYDARDNLAHVHVTGGSQARDQDYCYDDHWQLTNVMTGGCVGGTSVIGLGYDVQGNLANKNGTLYTFDYGNRMRAGGPETYRYDVQGRRIRSSSSAGTIYSLYAQSGQLLFQRDERSSKRRQYVYLGGSLVAESDVPLAGGAATVTYQHTDALGSPVATTNSAKAVLQRSEYEPYGYLLNRPMEDGPGYTGHVTDAATGLVYMQQRYCDPMIGHCLSVDPVTAYDKGDMRFFNRYAYAFNNPYKFNDPDGRCPDGCVLEAPIVVGTGAVYVAAFALSAAGLCVITCEKIMSGIEGAVQKIRDYVQTSTAESPDSTGERDGAKPADDSGKGNEGAGDDRNSKDDQRLSSGEIKKLDGAGHDVHELKGGKNASKQDLFKDKQGNVYVKPKDGSGPGEPTGINLKDL